MKSEKPKIIEIFDKLPKVITSCQTMEQLIYAQRYTHLAYKLHGSRLLRTLGDKLLRDRSKKINAHGK